MPKKVPMDDYLATNRDRWDELVDLHTQNSSYNLESLRQGQSTINELERTLLGDLKDKKILHLQCHFGMDSISLLYEGAKEVVGVDFSGRAVEVATKLVEELEVNARFIQSKISELDQHLHEIGDFDLVFTSYGTIVWLPELDSWAKLIAKFLKPQGKFLIVDAHPFANVFDDETTEKVLIPRYGYFSKQEPDYYKAEGSYATSAKVEHDEEYLWPHPLSEIINSLTHYGLMIDQLLEWPTINWQMLPFLERHEDGWYYYPEDWSQPKLPLCFALLAHQPPYKVT